MEQDEPDKGWLWGRAFILLVACSGAVVGLNVFLKGADALNNPSGAGEAIGSIIAVWVLGGIAPAIAHFAKKSPRKTLLKAWIAGCCVVFGLHTFVHTYAPLTEDHLEKKTGNGGYAYCGQKIGLPKEMGLPEEWSDGERLDLVSHLIREENIGGRVTLEIERVPPLESKAADYEGKYILPCATLFDYDKFQAYVADRKEEEWLRKKSARKTKKRMECLYEHRKEINDQNKAAIHYKCHQRSKE